MLKVNDKWFRIGSVLVPMVLVTYFINPATGSPQSKLWQIIVSACSTILVCESARFLSYHSHVWWKNKYRMLLLMLVGLAWTTLILTISTVIHRHIINGDGRQFRIEGPQLEINGKMISLGLFGYAFLNAIVNYTFLFLVYEYLYRQAQLKDTRQQKEKLEKEKLRAELLQLKGIVNPHFLFNNLNSLSSLISENPEKAQEFLDELTKVFRYLLRNNQTELTTLGEELKFIQTYYHLLQTRYGHSVKLEQHVDKIDEELLLPPLTLQLLVENAVKHNRLQKETPLQIELLSAPEQHLVVRNNILKKESGVESTGIGLQTINMRYAMLNQPGILIEKDKDSFSVIIPLLRQEQVPLK